MFNQNLDWIIVNRTDDKLIRIYYMTIKDFYKNYSFRREILDSD